MELIWDQVRLYFPKSQRGLQECSLRVRSGSFTVLSGPNGCGKSLLAEIGSALLKAQKGRVLLNGQDILKKPRLARGKIGLVFQDSESQIVGQTIGEDCSFGPSNLSLSPQEVQMRTQSALEVCGLTGRDQESVFHLSGGEKKRLALAGLLAMDCPVLILDEPFNGLDWPGTRDLLAVLVELHNKGKTLLVITHDLDKVLAHATDLALMNQGRIIAQGPPQDLWNQLEEAQVRRPRSFAHEIPLCTWLEPES